MAGRISRQPGDDPDTIHWRGDQREDLPSRLSDIPEAYRHTPPADTYLGNTAERTPAGCQ